jgi:hypothetical protein
LVSIQIKPTGIESANDFKNKSQTMIDLRGWLKPDFVKEILVRPMSSSATSMSGQSVVKEIPFKFQTNLKLFLVLLFSNNGLSSAFQL